MPIEAMVSNSEQVTASVSGSGTIVVGGITSSGAIVVQPGSSQGSEIVVAPGSSWTPGVIPDERLSSNIVRTTDARLSDSRVPKPHVSSHAIGGSDFLAPAAIGASTIAVASSLQIQVDGKAAASHTHPASAITSGTLSYARLPLATGLLPGAVYPGIGLYVSSGMMSVSYGTGNTAACRGDDARLSNSREWSASTVTQAEAEGGTATSRVAWTAQRVWQAIAAWWAASAAKAKLDGIASGATANQTDAHLLNRSHHTGTQSIGTVDGLQAAIDGKQAAGSYAAAVHTHGISGVTGLQAALANIVADSVTVKNGTSAYAISVREDSAFVISSGGGAYEHIVVSNTVVYVGGHAFDYWTGITFPDSTVQSTAWTGSYAHNHDDRYYTEAEVNTLLGGKQAAGAYATLDGSNKIPASLLPSYVDDVLEYANAGSFPSSGSAEAGKIYVAKDTNKTYRWSGSTYIEISPSPGSTDAVAEGSTNLYFTNARASAAAPVQSVAGRTGAVTIAAADVSGLSSIATTGSASDLGSGTVPLALLPVGTGSTQVAAGNHTHTVSAITDFALNAISDGDVLRYSGGKWRNYAEANLVDGGNW